MNPEAATLVLIAAFLHAAWNFAMRRNEGNLVSLWLSLLLAGGASLPVAAWFLLQSPPAASAWLYMAATGLIHAVYFSLLAMAYEGGEISLVYPIARGTGVAGTAILAFLAGIDTLSPLAGIGIVAVAGGILLVGWGHVSRGRHSTVLSVGLAMGVGATVIAYSLCDKLAVVKQAGGYQGGGLPPLAYICAVFLGSALLMTPYVLARGHRVRGSLAGVIGHSLRGQKRYVLSIGPASLATYLLILYAFRLAPASSVVAMRESSVVVGSLLGFVFLGERATARNLMGIAWIVAGVVLVKMA